MDAAATAAVSALIGSVAGPGGTWAALRRDRREERTQAITEARDQFRQRWFLPTATEQNDDFPYLSRVWADATTWQGDDLGGSGGGAVEAAAQVPGTTPSGEPTAAALRAAQRGDPNAFMALLAPERPRLESLAYRLLGAAADVPDVLQEVYLSAYRALPKYRGDARLATWLYRITYNACLAQRARRPEAADAQPDAVGPAGPDHADAVAERLDLAAALAALPVEQRALVLFVDRDGFDYQAAAEALSIPLGTVSSRLAAARAKLRRALALSEEGEQ